jgi:group II intron reverse transcriptase/maturase
MTADPLTPDDLPFSRHVVRLRFTRPARFAHFLHGVVVHGLLGHALRDRELPAGLVPAAPESGRVAYDAGDAYHLALTLAGEARSQLGVIARELKRIGASRPSAGPLGGNYEVEGVETLPPVDVETEAATLATGVGGSVAIRFVSPLRLERPADLADDGGSYLAPASPSPTSSIASGAGSSSGVDGVSPARFRDERETRIPALAGAVRRGEATASPLLGLPVRREDRRKVRPLAIPTVGDRVLQRAAAELLAGAVDTLFEDCSFAYRKGYSRAGAARAIQKAYRDGFRIVLDADISAFFEEVRWDRLFGLLEALFPGEPLLDLVREWVTAPVHFEGLRLRRNRGLPQGAPVSPLLANLYLDELDDEVLGEDFRLVRYADDFVVLCRDVESAERARDTVEESLAELGLELNEDETAVPKRSWLAQVPLDRIRGVLAERRSGRRFKIIGGV